MELLVHFHKINAHLTQVFVRVFGEDLLSTLQSIRWQLLDVEVTFCDEHIVDFRRIASAAIRKVMETSRLFFALLFLSLLVARSFAGL